jgi:hypothetical protein
MKKAAVYNLNIQDAVTTCDSYLEDSEPLLRHVGIAAPDKNKPEHIKDKVLFRFSFLLSMM